QVGDRPRAQERRRLPGAGIRPERRDAAEMRRGADRQRPVAEGGARFGQFAIFLEAVHVSVGRGDSRRPYAGFAGNRRERRDAADGRRTHQNQEDVPRGQFAVPAQDQNFVNEASMSHKSLLAGFAAVLTMGIAVVSAQSQVKKQTVEGITNFAQVETTVACAGAVKPSSVAAIKKMGFASIINLRLDTEKGAEIDAEAAAAKAVGIHFFHLPLDGNAPDPAV